MIARIIESKIKRQNKNAYLKVVESEIIPLLRQQSGFVEILSFFPEQAREDTVFTISLWTMKADAEYYEKEFYPQVQAKLRPYLDDPVVIKPYTLETPLFEHFADALAA